MKCAKKNSRFFTVFLGTRENLMNESTFMHELHIHEGKKLKFKRELRDYTGTHVMYVVINMFFSVVPYFLSFCIFSLYYQDKPITTSDTGNQYQRKVL